MENKASLYNGKLKYGQMKKRDIKEKIYRMLVFVGMMGLWHYLSIKLASPLLLPTPKDTITALIKSATDVDILVNLFITMKRVMKVFNFIMCRYTFRIYNGLSELIEKMLSGIIDSVRQVPIMAWVP